MNWLLKYILYILCVTSQSIHCYKLHSSLGSIVFTDLKGVPNDVHSEYYFGKCAHSHKILLFHHSWKYEEIRGRMMVRAWIDVDAEPECVGLRARSPYADTVRYHPFKFNICIVRITYNYAAEIHNYYYYEWYIPVEIMPNIEWDLFFFKG